MILGRERGLMSDHKSLLLAGLICLCLQSTPWAGEAKPEAEGKVTPKLEGYAKKYYEDFLKTLPPGYTVKPILFHQWSDDEHRIVPFLVSLTPLDPDGRPDGEEQRYDRWRLIGGVPYRKGVKHGLEKKFSYQRRDRRIQRVNIAEIPWQDGKINGVKKLYHRNGKIRLEAPFVHGVRDGVSKEYDLVGRVVKITTYRQGKRHGDMIENWTLTAKPRRIVPYDNDVIEGVVREYYDTGQLKKELPAKSDKWHGLEKQYDEEGALIKQRYWFEDEEVSEEEFRKRQAAK